MYMFLKDIVGNDVDYSYATLSALGALISSGCFWKKERHEVLIDLTSVPTSGTSVFEESLQSTAYEEQAELKPK